MRLSKLKEDRQRGQKDKELYKTTQKTKDRATRTPLKTGMNSGSLEG